MIEYIHIAIVFVAGIYLCERITPSFAVIFALSLILVLTIQAIFKHKFGIKILIYTLVFAAGIVICSAALDNDNHDLSDYEGRYVTVTGRICELPAETEGNTRYIISTAEVLYKEESVKIKDKLLVTSPYVFSYGDTVTFSGFVDVLPKKMNENSFDLAKYYKSRGIFFKMYSQTAKTAPQRINDFTPYSLGLYVKEYVSDIIGRYYTGDNAAIMKAVLTGNKREFSEEFNAVLERTGLKRFYYPAYLHVILFMSVITAALSFMNKKRRDIAAVFLLIIYSLINFQNSVFLKLCIMLIIFTLYKRRYGYVYYFDVLGITAIIMGILNPLVYFDAGFVMSMLSSALVYYFYDSVEKGIRFIKPKYIRRMVAVAIICSVGLIPVAAYFFGSVSLHSVVASFIMLPCVLIILVLSPVVIAMLAVFHTAPVATWITSSMLLILKLVPWLSDKLTFLGGDAKSTGFIGLLIYLFLVIAAVKRVKHKDKHALLALGVAAALCIGHTAYTIEHYNKLDITFVNVGQGDGAVITAPYRYSILIDGGGGNAYSDYNPGEKLFLEYLQTEGITKIDSAFVSHYHKDHVQGIIAAIENLRVRNVFMPDNMAGSEWRTALETAAKENNTEIHYVNEETLLTYNNGMTLRIIPPAGKTAVSEDENDTTFVYYITYGDFSAIFTGDMSRFAEKNLLEGGKVPEADLLKVAHHGSKSATCVEWAAAISPKYSVISVGENNSYYLPDRETLETLKDTIVYRTDYDGDIRFTVSKDSKTEIKTFNRRD